MNTVELLASLIARIDMVKDALRRAEDGIGAGFDTYLDLGYTVDQLQKAERYAQQALDAASKIRSLQNFIIASREMNAENGKAS